MVGVGAVGYVPTPRGQHRGTVRRRSVRPSSIPSVTASKNSTLMLQEPSTRKTRTWNLSWVADGGSQLSSTAGEGTNAQPSAASPKWLRNRLQPPLPRPPRWRYRRRGDHFLGKWSPGAARPKKWSRTARGPFPFLSHLGSVGQSGTPAEDLSRYSAQEKTTNRLKYNTSPDLSMPLNTPPMG